MAWLLGRVGDKADVHVVADNHVSTLWIGVPVRHGSACNKGIVKITVPFWVPTIIRGLIRGLI